MLQRLVAKLQSGRCARFWMLFAMRQLDAKGLTMPLFLVRSPRGREASHSKPAP